MIRAMVKQNQDTRTLAMFLAFDSLVSNFDPFTGKKGLHRESRSPKGIILRSRSDQNYDIGR